MPNAGSASWPQRAGEIRRSDQGAYNNVGKATGCVSSASLSDPSQLVFFD